jgi:protein O-mannosyl-transferase
MSKPKTTNKNRELRTRREAVVASGARLNVLAGVALIACAVFSSYSPAINGKLIFDDDQLVTDNDLVQSPRGLHQLWRDPRALEFYPITYDSYWIEWRMWEMHPAGYHVTNLILHVVGALLIWAVLRRLSVPGAFFAALIFAVHPVNVESAAWISQRRNMLSLLFFLLSIYWYLKTEMLSPALPSQGGPWEQGKDSHPSPLAPHPSPLAPRPSSLFYCLSLTAFTLAMLSKGSAAVLPVLLLGIIWWLRRLTRRDFLLTSPFFAVAAALTWVNIWFQTHGANEVLRTASFIERMLGAGAVPWFYLYKAFFPVDLCFIYPMWNISVGDPAWWIPLVAALAVSAVLWLYRNSWSRPFLFAWGFFCAALVPVMGFADVGFMKYSLVADHYQHIAIIGVVAILTAGMATWLRQVQGGLRRASLAIGAAATCILIYLTFKQCFLYRDPFTLYQAILRKNPRCSIAEINLGSAFGNIGNHKEAEKHYKRAIQFESDRYLACNYLGLMACQDGKYTIAIEYFHEVIRYKPDYADAYMNLGSALAQIGRIDEAIKEYRESIRIKPYSSGPYYNLGVISERSGRISEAIELYEQAIQLKPTHVEAHYNLGGLLFNMGKIQEAKEHFEDALRWKPDYIDARQNLGTALMTEGRYEPAISQFRQVMALDPNRCDALFYLAASLSNTGQSAAAQEAARKALDLARSQNNAGLAKKIEDWLNSQQ